MATNVFDTSKNTINVTSVTDENVYGFDDSKNKIDVTGNLITEIVPTVGQTYWVDGIECVCFYSNPASGDKLRVYSKNGQIHIVEAIKVSSGSVFKFIDKNHDLSYYTCGKDLLTYMPNSISLLLLDGENKFKSFGGTSKYGYTGPCTLLPDYEIELQNNAREATEYLINRMNNLITNQHLNEILTDICLQLDVFRKSHSNAWVLPYNTDLMTVNNLWVSNIGDVEDYLTSYMYTKYSTMGEHKLTLKLRVVNISQNTETLVTKENTSDGWQNTMLEFINYRVRLSAEF